MQVRYAAAMSYREFRFRGEEGLSLFCREYTSPAPRGTVICLHGLTRNSRDFTELAEHLAPTYRVLAPDLRGRGLSEWDPKFTNYHVKTYYQDIVRLITNHVTGRLAIIGTSLGGILAMNLAVHVPFRMAGIVVNDIGPELASTGLARISGYVGLREPPGTWEGAVAQMKVNYAHAYPDFDDAAWMAFAKACHREREDGHVVADYDPAIGDAVRASSRPFDLWSLWASIPVPVLAIRGVLSDLLSAETFERMAQEKKDVVPLEVPNRGHAPLLNEPPVVAAIDRFLADVFA